MARISGVDLPKKKRIEYGLTYIYGIGLHTSRKILDATGIDYNTRVFELTDAQVALIRNEIQASFMVEGDLRKKVTLDIKALMDAGNPLYAENIQLDASIQPWAKFSWPGNT